MDLEHFFEQINGGEFVDDNGRQTFIHLNHFMKKRILRNAPPGAVQPRRGSLVTISFCGKVTQPHTIVEYVHDFRCHLGDFELINGLEIVLFTMRVGEKAQLVMDYSFAYGIFGLKDINPDSENEYLVLPYERSVVYQIELLSVENEIIDDINNDAVLRQWVVRKKARGDFWLERLEFNKTLHLYNRAKDYLLKYKGNKDALAREVGLWPRNCPIETLIHNRIDRVYGDAMQVVNEVLAIEPINPMALYHKAKILILMGKTKMALRLMLMVTHLDGNNMDAEVECACLQRYEHMRDHRRYISRLFQEHTLYIALFIFMVLLISFAVVVYFVLATK